MTQEPRHQFAHERKDVLLDIQGVIKLGESAREFSSYLEKVLNDETGPVMINFESINYMDSTGLGELIEGAMQHAPQPDRHSICSAFCSTLPGLQALCRPEHLLHHGLGTLLRRFFQQVALVDPRRQLAGGLLEHGGLGRVTREAGQVGRLDALRVGGQLVRRAHLHRGRAARGEHPRVLAEVTLQREDPDGGAPAHQPRSASRCASASGIDGRSLLPDLGSPTGRPLRSRRELARDPTPAPVRRETRLIGR